MKGRSFISVGAPQQVVVFEAHDMAETPGACARKCATPELTVCVRITKFDGQFIGMAIHDGKGAEAPDPAAKETPQAQDGQDG